MDIVDEQTKVLATDGDTTTPKHPIQQTAGQATDAATVSRATDAQTISRATDATNGSGVAGPVSGLRAEIAISPW